MAKSAIENNNASDIQDPQATAAAASLDKVRDILFGQQARQSEKRFEGIEKRLSREIDKLRKDQEKAVAALRDEVDKRLGELGQGLETEKSERAEHVRAVEAELTGRMAELESSAAAAHEALRIQIDEQTHAVREEIAEAERRQAAALGEAVAQVRQDLAGRAHLAEVFRGLAASFDGEN